VRKQRKLITWLIGLLLLTGPLLTMAQPNAVIVGQVLDAATRQPLPGVVISIRPGAAKARQSGAATDAEGRFRLSRSQTVGPTIVPSVGIDSLRVSMVGYEPQTLALPDGPALLTVWLVPGQTLDELTVRPDNAPADDAQLSRIELPVAQLARLPTLLGEPDLLRVLQLLPGVQKASEGNAGIYVRGGGPDQNLILLDGATIYNPNHLLGFFSAFNGDALSRVTLTKGGFPARFGGRLSSVIELDTKDGDPDRLRAGGSLGLLASRLLLHGPLAGGKARFVLAGRRTYLDLLTRPFGALAGSDAGAGLRSYFYDLNAKLTLTVSPKDRLTASAFYSRDAFANARTDGPTTLQSGLNWQNRAVNLRWYHTQSSGRLTTVSLHYSQYDLSVEAEERLPGSPANAEPLALRYQSGIRDITAHYDLAGSFGPDSSAGSYRLGFQTIYHRFTPDAVVSSGDDPARPTGAAASMSGPRPRRYIDALESGLYAETSVRRGRWQLNGGLRLSNYLLIGEGTTRIGGRPPTGDSSPPTPVPPDTDTSTTTNGSSADRNPVHYLRLEPRLSMAWQWTNELSLRASVADMNQYVHLLSSVGVGLPTDLWVPTTDRLLPQRARQVAVGLVRERPGSGLSMSLEAYHKTMQNLVSYAEGASFLSNSGATGGNGWADNLTTGRGWSSGVEVFLQKKPPPTTPVSNHKTRLSGWIGYTWSRTQWQFDQLNDGQPFYPRYDRRHDFSIVGLYELSPGMTLGGTFVYGTGNALTLPVARFSGYEDQPDPTGNPAVDARFGPGQNTKAYGSRNSLRAEAYHRLDLSWQIRRQRPTFERTWAIGVYNVYNRRNPFYYSLEGTSQGPELPSKTVLYRYSLFSVLPSVSYSILF
jgi:hypothetical protein